MKISFTCFLISVMYCISVFAGIVRVPQDQPSIQAGIDAAVAGDTVLVAEGTWYENIRFKGKAITVASHFILDDNKEHIDNTIINGSQPSHPDSGSVVYFISGEDTNSVLSGFTISGGSGTFWIYPGGDPERDGGGIFVVNAGAKIEKNKIIDNHLAATGNTGCYGAGIIVLGDVGHHTVIRGNKISQNTTVGETYSWGAVLLVSIEKCLFENNRVTNNSCNSNTHAIGGGLGIFGDSNYDGPYSIRNNIISHNTLSAPHGGGGGILVRTASLELTNNIITNNHAATSWGGGGIRIDQQGNPGEPLISVLINNTIVNNSTTANGGGLRVWGQMVRATVKNTIVWGNSAPSEPQIHTTNGAVITVDYSDVQGGWPAGTGNGNSDPEFEDDVSFYLADTSPCIDDGDPDSFYNDPEDPNNPGFALWPAKGGLRNDMGAYGGPGSDVLVGIAPLSFDPATLPETIQLTQNYPNPFNPATTIEFALPKSGWVTLKVYTVLGEEVATLVSEQLIAGQYRYRWDASNLASGVYVYRIQAGGFTDSRKMLLIR